jgi:hypothetical protein
MFYHTTLTGKSDDRFRAGLLKAASEARSSSSNDAVFLTHTLKMLSVGSIPDILGEKATTLFLRKRVANINGTVFHLETDRLKLPRRRALLFGPFIDTQTLERAIAYHDAKAVVYLPWSPHDLEAYMVLHPRSLTI